MEVTKLSSKGQIVLPKVLRDSHDWHPGQEFSLEETRDGVLLRPTESFATTSLEDVAGCLFRSTAGRARTIDEMNEAIGVVVRARHDRGRY